MLPNTYDIIFSALKWAGIICIVLFYIHPTIFGKNINIVICIYVLLWLFVFIGYYYFNEKRNADVEGLWVLAPNKTNKSEMYDMKSGKMIPANGGVALLSENDTIKFMNENFTFGFFISIDKSAIELIDGGKLKNDYKAYQLIIQIPGVCNIYVDPFHETLGIEFLTLGVGTTDMTTLTTLKSQKWHQILFSVEGRVVDIYQNGILIKSVSHLNLTASRPGKPTVNMNPGLYARIGLIQSWPLRLNENDIITNYRSNTDVQGVPRLPKPVISMSGFPELTLSGLNFCVGSYCFDSINSETDALKYVNYEYA
jgi:hypothetical protein